MAGYAPKSSSFLIGIFISSINMRLTKPIKGPKTPFLLFYFSILVSRMFIVLSQVVLPVKQLSLLIILSLFNFKYLFIEDVFPLPVIP